MLRLIVAPVAFTGAGRRLLGNRFSPIKFNLIKFSSVGRLRRLGWEGAARMSANRRLDNRSIPIQ